MPCISFPTCSSRFIFVRISDFPLHFEFLHSSGLYHDLDAFQWYMGAHASSFVLLEHILIMSIFLFGKHWHSNLFCVQVCGFSDSNFS